MLLSGVLAHKARAIRPMKRRSAASARTKSGNGRSLPRTADEPTPDLTQSPNDPRASSNDAACRKCSPMNAKPELDEIQKNVLSRLRKIEGQIRGIQNMVSDGKECEDILIQVRAER